MQESKTAVNNFIAQYGLQYPFLLDNDGAVSQTFDIFTTPTTYFIDPDGVIASILPGVVNQNWIDQNLAATVG